MKKNFIWAVICCTVLLLSACDNYLDVKPYGRTIPKTAEEFAALIHTRLNNIDTGNDQYVIGNASALIEWDAVAADNFETCLTGSGGKYLGIYLGSMIGSQSNNRYSNLYEVIRDCNIVLGEMDESSQEADSVRAAALALRGVCYYQLLRLYCETPKQGQMDSQMGVPLVVGFDMEAQPNRSTMQQTVDQIEDDLTKSASYHLTAGIYRFSEDVAKGYLCRLYFWTMQWDKALALAQELIKKYPLLDRDAYEKMMNTSYVLSGNELIKAYRSTTASSSQTISSLNSQLSERPVSIRFLSNFASGETKSDIRYALWVNGKRQAKKTFFCGMRGAEFQLIIAECQYHLGNTAEALTAINQLRSKRISPYTPITMTDLPSINNKEIITTDAEGKSLTPLMALILSERRKEFFLEGDRFFELKRNGRPEFWTSYNGLKYVTLQYMYTFPIPYHDIELDNGLVQNPGYTELVTE